MRTNQMKLSTGLQLIADIAEGSTTPNSLPNIAKIARTTIAEQVSVSSAMDGYLRVCSCGGMPEKDINLIKRHIAEAARLGYFKNVGPTNDD